MSKEKLSPSLAYTHTHTAAVAVKLFNMNVEAQKRMKEFTSARIKFILCAVDIFEFLVVAFSLDVHNIHIVYHEFYSGTSLWVDILLHLSIHSDRIAHS